MIALFSLMEKDHFSTYFASFHDDQDLTVRVIVSTLLFKFKVFSYFEIHFYLCDICYFALKLLTAGPVKRNLHYIFGIDKETDLQIRLAYHAHVSKCVSN